MSATTIAQLDGTGVTTWTGAVDTTLATGPNFAGVSIVGTPFLGAFPGTASFVLASTGSITTLAGSGGRVTISEPTTIMISGSVTSSGIINMTSDSDDNGTGNFTQVAGSTISTAASGANINITAGATNGVGGANILVADINAGGGSITMDAFKGTINEFNEGGSADAAADLRAAFINLFASSGIGNQGTIEIDAGNGLVAGVANAGDIDLRDVTGGLTVIHAETANGNIKIVNDQLDMVADVITANGGSIDLTSNAGGIVDGNGDGNNLTAFQNSSLTARGPAGVIGRLNDPLDVQIIGTLTILAEGCIDHVSVSINGVVTGGIILANTPPCLVLFNGAGPASGTAAQQVSQGIGSMFDSSLFVISDFGAWDAEGAELIRALRRGLVITDDMLESPMMQIDADGIGGLELPKKWKRIGAAVVQY